MAAVEKRNDEGNDLLHRMGDDGVCRVSTEPSGRGMLTRKTSRARVLFFLDPATPMRASTSALRSFRMPTQSTLHGDNTGVLGDVPDGARGGGGGESDLRGGEQRLSVRTLASCWCSDRGPPRWPWCRRCRPLGRPWCCGRSPYTLGKSRGASLGRRRSRQTPATPPARSLPPAAQNKENN